MENEILNAEQQLIELRAEIETLKAQKSLVECVREAYSKEIKQPKVIERRTRYKKINGKKEAYTEVIISEVEFIELCKLATDRAFIEVKIAELKRLGDKLWHAVNQSEIYQRSLKTERENQLLKAEIKALNDEIFKMQEKAQAEPYVYYEDEITQEIE